MPSLAVVLTAFREFATYKRSPRMPKPGLVMDDPQQVAAYVEVGRSMR